MDKARSGRTGPIDRRDATRPNSSRARREAASRARGSRPHGRGSALVAFVAALLSLSAGCAAIPQQELAAYRQSFTEARRASEPVINDLGMCWREAHLLAFEVQPVSEQSHEQWVIDPAMPTNSRVVDEQVMLRHQVWIVLELYNHALAVIAAGRTGAHAGDSVHEFLASVKQLPYRSVTSLAVGPEPIGAIVAESLQAIERAAQARRFAEAVEAGGPFVEALLLALQEEVSDHDDMRVARASRARRVIEADVQFNLLPSLAALYQASGQDEAKAATLRRVNDVLQTAFGYQSDQLRNVRDTDDVPAPSATDLSQLALFARAIEAAGRQYAAVGDELRTFQDVLHRYHAMLSAVMERMREMRDSIRHRETVAADDVLLAAIRLHWQFTQYRDARSSR